MMGLALGKPQLRATVEVASFSHCKNIKAELQDRNQDQDRKYQDQSDQDRVKWVSRDLETMIEVSRSTFLDKITRNKRDKKLHCVSKNVTLFTLTITFLNVNQFK